MGVFQILWADRQVTLFVDEAAAAKGVRLSLDDGSRAP